MTKLTQNKGIYKVTQYNGIYKVIQYVAVCGKCGESYIANNCSTQGQFNTQFRKQGWRLSIDNKVTCKKCNRAEKEEK